MAAITTIAHGLRFPEGPIAMPDGSVVLVEIERQTLSRVRPNGDSVCGRNAWWWPKWRSDWA